MLSYEEAIDKLLSAAKPVEEIRHVPLNAAAGRVLAAAVQSTISVPPSAMSAMDGYAVCAADIPAAGAELPVSQRIPAGAAPTPLQPGTAARLFTGAPSGIGAPVKIRAAVPGCSGVGAAPAGMRWLTLSSVPATGMSVARTA